MTVNLAGRRYASAALVVAVLGSLAPGITARAQTQDVGQLINRLERMQRELVTLQQHVYRGARPAGGGAAGAGAPPRSKLDPRIAARLEVRFTQLENGLRNMTGLTEELSHAVQTFNKRLAKLVSDMDARLGMLEQARPPGGGAPGPGAAAATPPAGAAPPGTLGVLPRGALPRTGKSGTAAKLPGTGKGTTTAKVAAKTPRQQYDDAISLMLNRQNFSEAEKALRAFISTNPKHALTSNAHYWLGETHYVRKDYEQAAFAFADGFQKFPQSRKAPDNLLKLGMSLGQLGKKKEACTTYARLLENYPKAKNSLKTRVSRQQKRLNCR